ncbi:MAG TPA: NAD-dependent epimerase/dehydratase family protein [Pseudolabrys sp.]|nr:NAD-dependent epimerase/dehydratase family protein [Pseudolabrys sp.]
MTKRLLASGLSGFVGTAVLRELLRGGFDEIHAVSRRAGGPGTQGVHWHSADLRDKVEAVRLVREIQPTHLFHAAWIATPTVYLTSPENRDWMQATIAMVRAFAEAGGRRLIGVGSSAEYAPSVAPCVEDRTPLTPSSLYGEAKAGSWQEIEAIAAASRLEAVWGRLFTPFGPGSSAERLLPVALAKLRAGEPVPLASGEPRFDFVYTGDAARMLVGLLLGTATGAFNIGSGISRSPRAMIEALADGAGLRDRLRFTELPRRAWEPSYLVADVGKIAALGLLSLTPLPEAMSQILAGRENY